MTKALALLLTATWAYRLGWLIGARRMAASLSGRATGWSTYPSRIGAWFRAKRAAEDETLLRFLNVSTDTESLTTPEPPKPDNTARGPYL